jgi:hypothetical protein
MLRKKLVFTGVMLGTVVSLGAVAQTKKPAAKPHTTHTPHTKKKPAVEAGTEEPLATKEERAQAPAAGARDGGAGGAVVEAKTLDGGAKVFRFGEVEVEGRLKSPQIVYFLRRVRAEFAAGDLGHRTFMRELSETRSEPGF